jgi:hypothetical protein
MSEFESELIRFPNLHLPLRIENRVLPNLKRWFIRGEMRADRTAELSRGTGGRI